MKSPIVLLRSLFIDLKRLEPGVKGLDRDLETVEKRFKNEGDGFLTITLPSLCDSLDEGLSTGKFSNPLGFKRLRGRAIPIFLSGMLSEVFDPVTGNLDPSASLSIVKSLREFLRMFKKLALDDDQVITLDRFAKSKFFDCEETCRSSYSFDERQLFIIRRVSSYILPNIELFDRRDLNYKHGPGAVSEQLIGNQKWSSIVGHLNQLDDFGFDCMTYQSNLYHQNLTCGSLSDSARLISVPKNSKSRRTITVEPLLSQFKQQGLNILLRQEIERCSILRQCLSLTNQSKNQHLALEGSRTGVWATIDLTSASDLLSSQIVSLVFESKPSFLEGLFDCRSTSVSCDSITRSVVKYAGMGNATTFPVQSVVFAVLAISALLGKLPPTYRNVKRVAQSVRVYGDDIIVPSNGSHQVVDWITSAGLIVNTRKSFLVGNFKESCGVDAFRGVDVTPLYVRHHPIAISKEEPTTIAHYVSLSNQAWFRGLYTLSACFKSLAEEALRSFLPLVRSDSGVLGLHTRLEYSTIQRWNAEYQRPELRGFMLLPIYRKDSIDGYAALLKCLTSTSLDVDPKHLLRTPVRFKSRIARRWVAA